MNFGLENIINSLTLDENTAYEVFVLCSNCREEQDYRRTTCKCCKERLTLSKCLKLKKLGKPIESYRVHA